MMTIQMKGSLEQAAKNKRELLNEVKDLMATAESTGKLSDEDAARVDELCKEADEIQNFLDRHSDPNIDMGLIPGMPNTGPSNTGSGLASGLKNADTGRPLNVVAHDKKFAGDDNPLALGEALFSWLNGQPTNQQQGGVDSAGRFMINPVAGPYVLDLARARSVAVRLGAQSLQMDSPHVRIATVEQDPTAQWAGELEEVKISDVVFGLKELKARKNVCLMFASDEYIMDADNGAALLQSTAAAAMATEIDRSVLVGSGVDPEPGGISVDPNRNTELAVGTPADYAPSISAISKIYGANYQGEASGLGYVQSPAVAAVYQGLTDSTGQPLMQPQWVADTQKEITTNMPDTLNIVGDFTQVLLGMRMDKIRFEVISAGEALDSGDTKYNAVTQVGRFIRLTWYGDHVVLRPNHFTTLEGITLT